MGLADSALARSKLSGTHHSSLITHHAVSSAGVDNSLLYGHDATERIVAVHPVAGGGDTVAALNHAGVADDMTFVSTAGGAFLEWMEGKPLPGVEALQA